MSKDWDKHLKEWQGQGLLTAEQAAAILRYEQGRGGGSRLMLALTSLAVFSIGLGIISLIAANWDAIPAWFKLTAYFALMGAQVLALRRWDENPGVVREGLHLLYQISILAGIGLIAQVFHVPSDGWRGLALWTALSVGVMLRARAWYPIVLWQGSFAAALIAYVASARIGTEADRLVHAVIAAAVLGILCTWRGWLPVLQRRLTLWVSSVFTLLIAPWGLKEKFFGLVAAVGLVWLGVAWTQLPRKSRVAAVVVALCFFLRWVIMWQTEHRLENVLEALPFIAEALALGVIALQFEHHRIFDVLTLAMAVRLLVLFFSVFSGLLMNGAGFILFGLVILGLLHLWYRYRERLQAYGKDWLA